MTERSQAQRAAAVLFEDHQVRDPVTDSVRTDRVKTANYAQYQSNLLKWQQAKAALAAGRARLAPDADEASALEPLQRAVDQTFDEFRMSDGIADIEMAVTVLHLLSGDGGQ